MTNKNIFYNEYSKLLIFSYSLIYVLHFFFGIVFILSALCICTILVLYIVLLRLISYPAVIHQVLWIYKMNMYVCMYVCMHVRK